MVSMVSVGRSRFGGQMPSVGLFVKNGEGRTRTVRSERARQDKNELEGAARACLSVSHRRNDRVLLPTPMMPQNHFGMSVVGNIWSTCSTQSTQGKSQHNKTEQ